MPHDSIDEYLEALASQAPTPGGGAAAALTAAQGAALLSMVGHLSKGKSASSPVDWETFIKRMDEQRSFFLAQGDEDERAFGHVLYCMGLAKDADKRQERLEEALLGAAMPPLNILEQAHNCLQGLESIIAHANSHVVSDAAIAVFHLRAAMESSLINVAINKKYLKQQNNREELERRVSTIDATFRATCDELCEAVRKQIG